MLRRNYRSYCCSSCSCYYCSSSYTFTLWCGFYSFHPISYTWTYIPYIKQHLSMISFSSFNCNKMLSSIYPALSYILNWTVLYCATVCNSVPNSKTTQQPSVDILLGNPNPTPCQNLNFSLGPWEDENSQPTIKHLVQETVLLSSSFPYRPLIRLLSSLTSSTVFYFTTWAR